jgi:glucose-fructose oxidoreductase
MHTSGSLSRRRFIGQLSLAAAALSLPRPLRAANAPAGRKLGIAFAGLGNYATHQLAPAIRETEHLRIAGVITGTPAKGEQWRRKYDLSTDSVYSYETLDRIADNPDIDIVYVVTPPGVHRDLVVRAAKAGKHVICEKPMATNVRDCDAMIAACRDAAKKLSIGYRLEFEPHHIEMERLARDPAFGPFTKMRGGFGFRVGGGRGWRLDKKLAGGGPLPDVGIYVIQAGCRGAGDIAPIAVTAQEDPKTRPEVFTEVEETIRWKMEFPGGVVCDGFSSYNESANEFRGESADGRNWVEIAPAYSYGGLEGRTSRGPMKAKNINQQAAQMEDFARCILENRDTPVPGEMGRRDIAIMEAIYASAAAGGKRVEVKV